MYLYAWTHRYSRGFSPSAVFALTTLFKNVFQLYRSETERKKKTLAFSFRVVYLFYFSSLWFWQRWMCLLGAISHQQTNSSADFRCWLSPAACLEQKRCPSAHRVLAFVDVGSHADNTFLLVTHSSWSLSTIYIVSTFIHSLSAYPYKC